MHRQKQRMPEMPRLGCCKTKKAKDANEKTPKRERPKGPRDTKRSVSQINSEDSPDRACAFFIVDGMQLLVLVNVRGVINVAMIVDSEASCNLTVSKMYRLASVLYGCWATKRFVDRNVIIGYKFNNWLQL